MSGTSVELKKSNSHSNCHRVVATSHIEIPPLSECSIPARVEYGQFWNDPQKSLLVENTELSS